MNGILIGLVCLLIGGIVAWLARGWLFRGPVGFAVVFGDLNAAATAWKPGSRVYRLTGNGPQALSDRQVNEALGAHLDALRRARSGSGKVA